MNQVAKLNQLGKFVVRFVGKNIDESIALAEAWAKRENVTLGNYYLQYDGRSIITDSIKATEDLPSIIVD